MKPRIKPLPRTGDAARYQVTWLGRTRNVMVSGCEMAVTGKHPLKLLPMQIAWVFSKTPDLS